MVKRKNHDLDAFSDSEDSANNALDEPRSPSLEDRPGTVPRRWRQWYARSMDVEMTPLEIAEPPRRKWGRYVYLLIVIAAIGLGVDFVAGKAFWYNATGTVGVKKYPVSPDATVTVKSIAVQPGQTVKAGQALMRFSSPQLDQQLAQTRADIAKTRAALQRQTASTRGSASALRAEIGGLRSQLQALVQQYADQQQQVQTLQNLANNRAVNPGDVTRAREALLQTKAKYDATAATLRSDRQQLRALRSSSQGNHSTPGDLVASLKQLQETLKSRMDALELHAPVTGVVARVPVTQGQVVKAGEPAAIIVPGNDQRTLLYFPPAARSRLRVGERLTVTAPDGTNLPMRIERIFPSVESLPSDLQASVQKKGRAIVVLVSPAAHGAAIKLQPGTPVTAEVSRWVPGKWFGELWSSTKRRIGRVFVEDRG